MQAKDIMTEKVITFSPETGIVEAARVLMENHINGAPVLDGDGRLVGILCRDDLISQQKKLPLPSYFVVLDKAASYRSSRRNTSRRRSTRSRPPSSNTP